MAASSIRFGPGCTKEVGMDMKNMKAKKVVVVTDSTVAKLNAMKQVTAALESEGIDYVVYQDVRVEPKDTSYVTAKCPIALGNGI
jgi:hydroxyacid-oxoacid transhydrogenase